MVRAGADLVLTQHSHCIGCRERYRDGEILYGQGNFNFVEAGDPNPQLKSGLVVTAEFGETLSVEYTPVAVTETGIRLAAGEEKTVLLSELERRSGILQDETEWIARWEAFCRTIPDYVNAVKNAFRDVPPGEFCNQVFPHYLDCEAHEDVWRVIYPTWHKT